MATKAESEIKTAVARFDEQFREVRQDIRDLRADNKSLRDKIDANHASLTEKIDSNHASANAKIDAMRTDMTAMRESIADLKALQKALIWVLGGAITLITVVITIAKALQWIHDRAPSALP
jgi:chromosome segregation ATPase